MMAVSYMNVRRKIQVAVFLAMLVILCLYAGSQRGDVVIDPKSAKSIKAASHTRKSPSKKNILFIMSDDLRPQLNCYKGPHFPNPNSDFRMHTPGIDKLAGESLLFRKAYVQMSVCGPSRASLLTGRRPDTISNWHLKNNFRMADRNVTSLPQYFKQQGYWAEGVGKIFHRGENWAANDPVSWTIPWKSIKDEYKINLRYGNWSWSAATKEERAENALTDETILDQGIESLRRLAPNALSGEQNFFLGVGFLKPHLPFVFPKEFLELYPLDKMDLPSVKNKYFPMNYPQAAFIEHCELTNFRDVFNRRKSQYNEVFSDDEIKMYRRAYFATVSFVDSMVGLLVEELEALGLADSTVVTFMGDHGWHLGENGIWGKYTNFEQATHTPLMLKIPGRTEGGIITDAIVEFVDIFQTIVEAAGMDPVPQCPENSGHIDVCTEGTSLLPLIDNPKSKVKDVAISQIFTYTGPQMGYSLRSDRYRYVEWIPIKKEREKYQTNFHLLFDKVTDSELYDLDADPEENINIAGYEKYGPITKYYSKLIRDLVQPSFMDVKSRLF